MSISAFFQSFPMYNKFKGNNTVFEVYDFLSQPEAIDRMLITNNNGKSALSGVVLELEDKFDGRNDLDLSNNIVKQMIGCMVKFVVLDFGYESEKQVSIGNAKYFRSATRYRFDKEKQKKRIQKIIVDISTT